MARKIKVLIVDDSLFIRQMFTQILSSDDGIEVVGAAENADEAREKIKLFNPDVITLDIEMPGINGLQFLEKIMKLRPIPVVMASSLTQKGADATIMALELGAVDYVPKTTSSDFDYANLAMDLIHKVKNASKVKVRVREETSTSLTPDVSLMATKNSYKKDALFAIGSSTGGVESLKEVLTKLPFDFPPIVVTQHMPPKFTRSFAERLNKICAMHVKEAENGDVILPGNIYIAQGGMQFQIIKRGVDLACVVSYGEKVSGHIPSVDVLFSSVAKTLGSKAYGVILTGMGKDGAKGMLEMKNSGSYNIGQDEASSVVYGMPKAAFLNGAVDAQYPLQDIAGEMIKLVLK